MPNVTDLSGKRFGRWKVLHRNTIVTKYVAWTCQCRCGTTKDVRAALLANGRSKSCGCLRRAIGHARGKTSRKHGMNGTPEYMAYHQAKHRCTNPNSKSWDCYGGRGIRFSFMSFEQFFAELGLRPSPRHSLDRVDNEGHYEPGNIRWATREEQSNNRRKRNKPTRQRFVTANGRTMNIRQWAEETGVSENAITKRLGRGWPPEEAVGV